MFSFHWNINFHLAFTVIVFYVNLRLSRSTYVMWAPGATIKQLDDYLDLNVIIRKHGRYRFDYRRVPHYPMQ